MTPMNHALDSNSQEDKQECRYQGRQDWSSKVKQLPDGNERIIEITIATKVNICIINAYLPTHGTNSSEEYRECLDVIHNIIHKYRESHVIFLCGDLNGILIQSRMNKHDRLLKELIRELDLTTNIGIGSQSTFFHHAHNSESQIDYILTTNKDMIKDYTISEKGPPIYLFMYQLQ